MSKSSGPKHRESTIAVPDAPDVDQFLAHARRVWYRTHPEEKKRRGRPSEMERVFGLIWEAELAGNLAKTPTQGKLFRLVQEKMKDHALSEKAIRKYAKMWLLLFRKPPEERSDEEIEWLTKHNPVATKAHDAVLPTIFKYSEKIPIRSKGKIIGTQFIMTLEGVEILHQHLITLHRELEHLSPRKTRAAGARVLKSH